MGKTGRPFTLYTRPRKRGKPVYYVRYRNPGGWTVAESTGHTSEGAAESYALEQLRTGAVVPTAVEAPTFAQWAVGFWDTGGRYDRARRARGYVLSPTYLRIAELTVRKHLSPTFDRLKLTDMSSELLENHFLKVFEAGKLTARTVNSIMSVLRAMLREAYRLGRIRANPMERVSKFKEQPRVRGVLSLAELRALFGPDALENALCRTRHSAFSRGGWYSDTPRKGEVQKDALLFPSTTIDNISGGCGAGDKGKAEPAARGRNP